MNIKDPEGNVLETEDGYQAARQAKPIVWPSHGTNPDCEGRESYAFEHKDSNDESWRLYDSQARSGDFVNSTFLRFLRRGLPLTRIWDSMPVEELRVPVFRLQRGRRHNCKENP